MIGFQQFFYVICFPDRKSEHQKRKALWSGGISFTNMATTHISVGCRKKRFSILKLAEKVSEKCISCHIDIILAMET